MSMTVITIFQLLGLFASYLIITVLLPHFVVGKSVRFKNNYERFMLYTMLGNFYVINLVYVLELLHISCMFTLLLFTIVPAVIIKVKLENIPFIQNVSDSWATLRKLTGGQLKVKAYRDRKIPVIRGKYVSLKENFRVTYVKNWVDVVLIIGVLASLFYVYGVDAITVYGYKASDIVVHNYWVNGLCDNDLFTAGIYPYGFHNVVYYIHAVFRIDTYVILRLMAFVQVVFDALVLLCVLKCICRYHYTPYAGTLIFTVSDFLKDNTYTRYRSSLPQEYGIMFVLPALYCGYEFFREQRRKLRGSESKQNYKYLFGFLACFSTAFTVHLYGAVIIFLGALAMAIGYFAWFIKKEYFGKIVTTLAVAVVVSLLPAVIAFASGTKFHSSFQWGLSVMQNSEWEDNSISEEMENNFTGNTVESHTIVNTNEQSQTTDDNKKVSLVDKIAAKFEAIVSSVKYSVVKPEGSLFTYLFLLSPIALCVAGIYILAFAQHNRMYGAMVLSVGLFMAFSIILVSSNALGIISLMDMNRASVYFGYTCGMGFSVLIDALLFILFERNVSVRYADLASAFFITGFAVWLLSGNYIRDPQLGGAAEMNDEIECITKIIANEKDFTWTICGSSDSLQMVYGHGYHFQLIDFLLRMESIGNMGVVRIPSETVFVFVEKYPIEYYEEYDGVGNPISEEYALMDLHEKSEVYAYYGESRFVLMSRVFYWVQAFATLYPNEVSTYFETDNFVCYKIEQNPYRLFNFAIDYGYNIN